jgi:hypothetical protein
VFQGFGGSLALELWKDASILENEFPGSPVVVAALEVTWTQRLSEGGSSQIITE